MLIVGGGKEVYYKEQRTLFTLQVKSSKITRKQHHAERMTNLMDEKLREYARLLVRVGLNVQKDQRMIIS